MKLKDNRIQLGVEINYARINWLHAYRSIDMAINVRTLAKTNTGRAK